MTRLQELYDIAGQSPWLDNLRRDWLESGELAKMVEEGVRGITSNPTILANAISGQETYDDQFRGLMKDHTVESAYWELAITDIEAALKLLRLTYDTSDGEDGFVSLEVSRPWLTTATARCATPGCCTSGSTNPTCWSRSRPPRSACRPFKRSSARVTAST
jgi:transaldolase